MAMSPEGAALSVVSDMEAAWAKLEKDGHIKICPMLNVAPSIGRENRSICCIPAAEGQSMDHVPSDLFDACRSLFLWGVSMVMRRFAGGQRVRLG